MKVLLVLDQFDGANNGNTISARRLAETLRAKGHEVRIASQGEDNPSKWGFKDYHLPFFDKLVTQQGFVFGTPDEKKMSEAVGWADVVHVMMPFALGKSAVRICLERNIPCTGAFHVQPENIWFSVGLGNFMPLINLTYRFANWYIFKYFHYIHCPSHMIENQLVKHGYKSEIRVISNGISDVFKFHKAEKRAASASLKDRLDGVVLTIVVPAGESGKLFGSVTSAMVQAELQKLGFEIEKKKIEVATHAIKMTGTYSVIIHLYENEFSSVKLIVQSEAEKLAAERKAAEEAEAARKAEEEAAAEPDRIELVSYAPNELRYEYSSAEGGKVVFSEVYYPVGWTLTVEDTGELLPIELEGDILRSAFVPAGEHALVMRFDPPSYRTGETVSRASSIAIVLVVLLAAGFVAVPALSRKRK